MEKIAITQGQMNLVLMAVEHGFKQREKGNNLEAALASVFELYEVKRPDAEFREANRMAI